MGDVLVPTRPDPEWGRRPSQFSEFELSSETLSGLPIFQTLTPTELQSVDRIVHHRHFVTGEVILRAWVERSGLYVIQRGLCHVVRPGSEDEGPRVVGELVQGDLLGEFSLLDRSPRTTTIVAAEPCDLLGFFRPDLMELIETEPRTGFKILHQLSKIMARSLRDDLVHLRINRKQLSKRQDAEDLVHP